MDEEFNLISISQEVWARGRTTDTEQRWPPLRPVPSKSFLRRAPTCQAEPQQEFRIEDYMSDRERD